MNRREFTKACLAATVLMPRAEASCGTGNGEFHAFSRVFEFMKDMHKVAAFLQ